MTRYVFIGFLYGVLLSCLFGFSFADYREPDSADISVTKVDSLDPVIAGNPITYTVTVNSTGPSEGVNVVLTDTLPPQIQDPMYSLGTDGTWNPWGGYVNLGDIDVGGSQQVLIKGMVLPSFTGTITNTASVSSDTLDPVPANNIASQGTMIEAIADLSLAGLDFPEEVMARGIFAYTVQVGNDGPSWAEDVVITDTLPSDVIPLDARGPGWECGWSRSSRMVNCWLPSISIGTAPAITFTVTAPVKGGTITTTLEVGSAASDPDISDNSAHAAITVIPVADLSVIKEGDPDRVIFGQQLVYTMTVTNTGPSDAVNVKLRDEVSLLNPEYSTDGGDSWQDWDSFLDTGAISATNSLQVLIRGAVKRSHSQTITNTACVTSDTHDPDTQNNCGDLDTWIMRPIPPWMLLLDD